MQSGLGAGTTSYTCGKRSSTWIYSIKKKNLKNPWLPRAIEPAIYSSGAVFSYPTTLAFAMASARFDVNPKRKFWRRFPGVVITFIYCYIADGRADGFSAPANRIPFGNVRRFRYLRPGPGSRNPGRAKRVRQGCWEKSVFPETRAARHAYVRFVKFFRFWLPDRGVSWFYNDIYFFYSPVHIYFPSETFFRFIRSCYIPRSEFRPVGPVGEVVYLKKYPWVSLTPHGKTTNKIKRRKRQKHDLRQNCVQKKTL